MPVCGTVVLPSEDTHIPDQQLDPAAEAVALQILELKRVPHRPKFLVTHLAMDLGGSERMWQRAFKVGDIWGFLGPEGWETYWPFLVRYVAERQNVAEMN